MSSELRISVKTGDLILQYLKTRPWSEVANIIQPLLREAQASFPKEEEPTNEDNSEQATV